eukprot:9453457-Lingulodinium_polyedra.AAC.1
MLKRRKTVQRGAEGMLRARSCQVAGSDLAQSTLGGSGQPAHAGGSSDPPAADEASGTVPGP